MIVKLAGGRVLDVEASIVGMASTLE